MGCLLDRLNNIRYKPLGGRIGIFEIVLGDGYAELLHIGYL
jgi:hypothetical protein